MSEVKTLVTLVLGGVFDHKELGDIDIVYEAPACEALQRELVTDSDDVHVELVSRIDYDAAQSHLAALREDLVTAKRNEHNSEVAYKSAIERQEELRTELAELEEEFDTLEHSNVTLKLSLADAERRNAELIEACAKICEERSAYYDSGDDDAPGSRRSGACQNCADVIRWRKPDIAHKPDACLSDGGTCGLGGYCAECPHAKPEASEE